MLWFLGRNHDDRDDGYGVEFFVLLIGSALGMILMTSTLNLLMIVIAIEMASLPSYAIVGFNKRDRAAAEASLKYAIFVAVSASLMLYGVSLLYGAYGTLNVAEIATAVTRQLHLGQNTTLIYAGLAMFMAGVAFKIAAVPFHFWCPDAFEGARIEVTAWLSVSSKAAALVLLFRLVDTFTTAAQAQYLPQSIFTGLSWGIGLMAAVSCTWGNFAAYRQTQIKRLLAYSSIAHAGYMMMAAAVFAYPSESGGSVEHSPMTALMVYLAVYALMNLGAFTVAAIVAWKTGDESITAFSGLGRRAPWLAVSMVCCLVSLVGLPPFGGFIAKTWLLLTLAAPGNDFLWALVIVAVLNTLVSLFFYFRIIRAMFLVDDHQPAFTPPIVGSALTGLCSLCLMLMGTLYITGARDVARRVTAAPFSALAASTNNALSTTRESTPAPSERAAANTTPRDSAEEQAGQ